MEKVKLTAKQAEAIESMLEHCTKHALVSGYVDSDHLNTPFYKALYKKLKPASLDTIIRALYIGYEVEPELKVGDKVIYKYDRRVCVFGEIVGFEREGEYGGTNFECCSPSEEKLSRSDNQLLKQN